MTCERWRKREREGGREGEGGRGRGRDRRRENGVWRGWGERGVSAILLGV